MIGLSIFLVLAALCAVISYASSKDNGKVSMVFLFLTFSLIIVGIAAYPVSSKIEAEHQSTIDAYKVAAEAHRAQVMIDKLGTAKNYVRYLEAIK